MKVSVIVSIYNGANILPVTLPPLLNQDYPENFTEIILVNDGSTDDTRSLLEHPEWTERCKIIQHPNNRGLAATRNSGIKVATGDLFIILDCDIEVGTDFISRHVELHKNHKIIGVLSNIRTRLHDTNNKFYRYIFLGKRGAQVVGENKPLPFNYFILGCTSVKAYALKKTGKFNEKLYRYGGEDLEFAYRLEKKFPEGLFYTKGINVYMHNVKTLEEALSNFRQYGQYNVPIILKEHPELAPYVAADFVKSMNGKWSWKVLLGTILINPFVFQLV
ncbi:MAG: glycosyltransferase family 2 protein, partial [Candidatus Cloacimonetes bacterium]|nr:glycosyltransferase family 2 protein [Candidatus Cloacimonadota bacterium]